MHTASSASIVKTKIDEEAKNKMLRFFSLSSGSCGNCYYLGTSEKGILIDAGASCRRLVRMLKDNDINVDTIQGVLVTHSHLDHIKFLGSFCKKLHKPVYTASLIDEVLSGHSFTSPVIGPYRNVIPDGEEIDLSGISVRFFEVTHDARQMVGYAIGIEGHRFVIMTDIGRLTDEALEYASCAHTLVIESNYDMDMLQKGSYTPELKQRIAMGSGHLSNDECAATLKQIVHPGLRNIFLCHLSENNNTPELAYSASSHALQEAGYEKGTIHLRCLPRTYPSPVFNL